MANFKLALLLLVAISMPLLEARPHGVRVYHDDLGSSLLPLPQAAKEMSNSDDALVGNSRDVVASASPSSLDDALHRLARLPPSPRPLSRRPASCGAGQLSSSSGPGVGGARKPSAPPSPRGPKPPHPLSSEQGGPRPRPLAVDVSDVLLRVLHGMVGSRAVHISDVVRGMQMQSC